jgi:hypothetical protein
MRALVPESIHLEHKVKWIPFSFARNGMTRRHEAPTYVQLHKYEAIRRRQERMTAT